MNDGGGLPGLGIRRPWLVVVINLLIVIAGLAALQGVEVRELPNIDRPVVSVRAEYPGAAPETLDGEVTRVLEAAAARVPGVHSVRSASEEGTLRVHLSFRPGVDLVTAANDVREAVSRAERELPAGVRNVTVIKADADAQPVMRLAVSSATLSIDALSRAVEERIEPELVSVDGVADVTMFGARERVLRVRIDPQALAARGLAVSDIAQALATARADVPAGSLDASQQEVLVRANASLATPEQVQALRLPGGSRLADVAEVFFAPADAQAYVRLDGRTVVSLGVVRQAQANSLAISDGVRAVIARLAADDHDLTIRIVSDDALFIRGSIGEVLKSMGFSVLIVAVVVGLFIGQWRATLIPVVAIPVSLIGTLAALWAMGFSLNLITLLALLLATGLVVDDAIVVLENIQRRRREGLAPRAAAVLGARQVFFAVLATTATLISVFVPISFLPSAAGKLFTEFGFVMAFAVLISSFVALSLAPMMASRIDVLARPGRLGAALGSFGATVATGFDRALDAALRHRLVVIVLALLLAIAAGLTLRSIPQELAPAEDRGVLMLMLRGPDGTGLRYTDRQMEQALRALDPLVDEGLVGSVFTITGRWDPNRGLIIAPLRDWADRDISQQQIAARLQPQLAALPGAQVRIIGGNSLGVRNAGGGLQAAIVGTEHRRIAEVAYQFAEAIEREMPGAGDVRVEYDATQPQLSLRIDRERAADLGVAVDGLDTTLRALVDGTEVATMTVGDRSVPVMLESAQSAVRDPQDLLGLTVRNAAGQAVPLSQFVRFEDGAIAAQLDRHGQRRAVELNLSLDPSLPLQRAVDELRALAQRTLPDGMSLLLLGDAATLEETSRGVQITFAIALLVVFLVLVAQFESVTSAATVLLTVPFGLAAAAFAMVLSGVSLNLYSQIGLLLLVGVMAKNGILMVEFADQLRDAGKPVLQAAREAASTRLRAILMTMASTVLGAVPLLLSSGAGAEARNAIGWVIFGGLALSALFTLFLAPVIYTLLAPLARPRASEAAQLASELAAAERRP
ncbi:efflux RND transporter permease subunit [Piscinibacter sakaiensis]|uniref:efflux RND transporter permease subunit n=1 Tax=Piscinibacter sakaiensis TaxID=1547922 RepID=UPI003AABC6E4